MLDLKTPPDRPLIAASILSADFALMADECRDVLDRGADLLHVDVMDGHFVPNLTMGPDMVRALRKHFPDTFLDVHLMVENPGDYIQPFADAGANLLSFHLEVCQPMRPAGHANPDSTNSPNNPDTKAGHVAGELIDRIHSAGLSAGMVINPPTEPDGLEPYLDQLELLLIMSVNPGKSGQAFIPDVLDKARHLKPKLAAHTRLEMDGGLKPATAPLAIEAGIDMIVSASALFGASDRTAAIDALRGC